MNYAALKSEVALPAYAGLSDAEIADALNAETIATVRDVPTHEARGLLLATGEWGAVVLLSRQVVAMDDPVAPAVMAAITAVDTLSLTQALEVSREANWQAVQALTAGLMAAGVLSEGTRDALLALRDATTSRAAQLGLGEVRPGDVATARATAA